MTRVVPGSDSKSVNLPRASVEAEEVRSVCAMRVARWQIIDEIEASR
jgi:hypothetical protein